MPSFASDSATLNFFLASLPSVNSDIVNKDSTPELILAHPVPTPSCFRFEYLTEGSSVFEINILNEVKSIHRVIPSGVYKLHLMSIL